MKFKNSNNTQETITTEQKITLTQKPKQIKL